MNEARTAAAGSTDCLLEKDAALVARAVDGDEAAMVELYSRHADRCRARAFAVLRDASLAEDATQEAFVDLWRRGSRFDESRAPLAAWLCVLAHRRAVDISRRRARRAACEQRSSEGSIDRESYTAEELLLLNLTRREVQRAICELGLQHRRLVELAYYGGLSHQQLALELELPLGTIKSRMQRALALLARALGTRDLEGRGASAWLATLTDVPAAEARSPGR